MQSPKGVPLRGIVGLFDTARPFVRRVPTTLAGTFRFDGIPAGKYLLCGLAVEQAQADRPLIDTCNWRSYGTPVAVGGGGAIMADLTLPFGRAIRVSMQDPGELLKGAAPRGLSDIQVAASAADGVQLPARITAVGRNSREYEIVAPLTPVKLVVRARNLRVASDRNRQPAGELVESLEAGDQSRSLAFSVSRQ